MFRLPVSDRIELRLWEKEHAEVVFALVRQNRDLLSRWVHWVHQVQSAEDIRHFIGLSLDQFAQGKSIQTGLYCAGRFIGGVGLVVNTTDESAEVGYWLTRLEQGKGLATEAVQGMIAYGFQELRLNRIEIRCCTENRRSQAVAERLGFTREGILRQSIKVNCTFQDQFLYSLLSPYRQPGLLAKSCCASPANEEPAGFRDSSGSW